MNIFVVNSGSSSIKYQFFRMPSEVPVCSGLVERIGLENAMITHKVGTGESAKVTRSTQDLPDHRAGLQAVTELLTSPEIGVMQDTREIDIVGHRVVHGGETFAATTIITPEVKAGIRNLFALAPLHNPSNYLGIEVAEKIFSRARQIAVFDTAFHQTLPEKAFRYAIPNSFYTDHRIRAYGFHGTSHKYVSEQAANYLQKQAAKIITVHLGNGCSMAAVSGGQSIDTTMGFGPLSGLIMGTRSGDIDPSVIFHLVDKLGYSPEEVNNLLNKQSGMLGLTGHSDMRDISQIIREGSKEAALAYEMYAYRIKKYIGAYAAAMNGLDAIVFTAGVGENDAAIRVAACQEMGFLGIHLDTEKNRERSTGLKDISLSDSPVRVLLIPTNEELEIAQQCLMLVSGDGRDKVDGEGQESGGPK